MTTSSNKLKSRAVLVLILASIVLAFAFLIAESERLPSGPVDIVWDREACAHCKMHIGERRFAAQLQRRDGVILNYDDPGCLLLHLEGISVDEIHALWFHDVDEERWRGEGEVAFRPVELSPMGYGLGATSREAAGAVDIESARTQLRARSGSRGGH